MEMQLTIVLFIFGSSLLHVSVPEELFMQIIAPERPSTERMLTAAIGSRIALVNGGRRNPLRSAGYSIEVDIKFTDNQFPTPEELLDVFCEDIFTKNASVIMSINYAQLTLVSNQYVIKLAQGLGYPVISWDPYYPAALESDTDNLVLQIAPTIYHECKAIVLLLERYNWTEFSIVTTRDTGQDFIDCMGQMVKETSIRQGYLTKPRFTNIATVIIEFDEPAFYLNDKQQKYVKKKLQELVKAKSRIILFHTKKDDTENIIEIAVEMGLTGSDFGWILTSASVGDLSLSRGTRLPFGFIAVSQNRSVEKVEEAIDTGIKIWSEALLAMIKARKDTATELFPKHNCDSDIVPWKDSRLIYQYMKDVVIKEANIRQPISFTDNGVIEHVELNLLNVRPGIPIITRRGRVRPTRNWDTVGRIYPKIVGNELDMVIETNEIVWPGQSVTPPLGRPKRRFFRIVTKEEEPFIMYVAPDENGGCGHHAVPCVVNGWNLKGNRTTNDTIDYCCTGLCVEILKMLAEKLNFDFELYDVPDGQWGVIDTPDKQWEGKDDTSTQNWTGLIKEIVEERADMVLSAFIINQIRSTAVDFSEPFLESGITIMVSIRKGAISPYAFLEPYDFYSWILILIFSVHATGASIFIFEWLSPSGLDKGNTSTVEHKFSLFRSFWLIWAMLFGAAVSIDVPRGVSSRFLANVWALFALVFLASYTANLAAFMITIDEYYNLSGIEDWRLINPTKLTPHFKFATIANSSTDVNLKLNYPRMHKYMSKYNQSDVATAKASLKTHSIHAFIYDANVLEYTAGRDEQCYLLTVGRWYATSGYGIAFKRGSTLVDEVNAVVLNLQHNGEIERLQKFWLSGACHAKKVKKDKSSNKIGILNFISAFILLAAGVLLGVLLLALEHLYFKSGRKCLKKYDKCGCCALVSLSMGKSLTFEQSVFTAIDIQRKHKCKDALCELHLWQAKHQLDMALLKMKEMQTDLDELLDNQVQPSIAAADIAIESVQESVA